MNKKIFLSLLMVAFVQLSFVQLVDKQSSQQLDQAFKRSVTVFAIARSLNGLISVLQGTEIYATPAGVGVNFAVGQIVDPMNDMVERFSWVMLMSSVSLGVQELLLHFGQSQIVQLFLSLSVILLLALIWIPKIWHHKLFDLLFKSFVILTFLRFLVPSVVLLSESVYQHTLQQKYETAKAALEMTHLQTENVVDRVRHLNNQGQQSWLDSLNVSQKIENFKMRMNRLWEALKQKFNSAIEYMLVLIAIFVLESIFLPLFFLWVFIKLFRGFMSVDISQWIDSKGTIKDQP